MPRLPRILHGPSEGQSMLENAVGPEHRKAISAGVEHLSRRQIERLHVSCGRGLLDRPPTVGCGFSSPALLA